MPVVFTHNVIFMKQLLFLGDDISMTGDQSLLTPQEIKTMGDDSMPVDNRKSWEENWLLGDPVSTTVYLLNIMCSPNLIVYRFIMINFKM